MSSPPNGRARKVSFHFRVTTEEMHRVERLQRRMRERDPDIKPPSRTDAVNHAVRVALGEAEPLRPTPR